VGVRSIRVDTDLGPLPPTQSLASRTYAAALGHLAYLYCPFLYIEMGAHGGGLRHIRVFSLCKRISYSPNGTSTEYQLPWAIFHRSFRQADSRVSRIFIIPIVLFHLVVAFLFKVMFFSYYVVKVGAPDPIPSPSDPGPVDPPGAMFF